MSVGIVYIGSEKPRWEPHSHRLSSEWDSSVFGESLEQLNESFIDKAVRLLLSFILSLRLVIESARHRLIFAPVFPGIHSWIWRDILLTVAHRDVVKALSVFYSSDRSLAGDSDVVAVVQDTNRSAIRILGDGGRVWDIVCNHKWKLANLVPFA